MLTLMFCGVIGYAGYAACKLALKGTPAGAGLGLWNWLAKKRQP